MRLISLINLEHEPRASSPGNDAAMVHGVPSGLPQVYVGGIPGVYSRRYTQECIGLPTTRGV